MKNALQQAEFDMDGYQVSIHPAALSSELETDWRALQTRVNPHVFLDWLWISTWLESYAPDARVLRIKQAGELKAVGVFGLTSESRHGLLQSTVALLHQTGVHHKDQIWIEYNGLLATEGHEDSALAAAIKVLQQHCEEIRLSMLPKQLAIGLNEHLTHTHSEYEVQGFKTCLATLKNTQTSVIESLSANTRHQLRRSLRRYEQAYGPHQLTAATSADEALVFFEDAGPWHKSRWPDSGFSNPAFLKFHKILIKRGFDHGTVQLFRLSFGERLVGVFYFLISGRQVYFYLQGVRREADGKLKPGLTGHWLLMQHFLEQDMDVYDFMGGESQYKQQLSNVQNSFVTMRVHNGALKFRVEDRLRQLKHRLLGS
ncbi:conserved hypothetical protein [gamma proteobacterium NOR5-3]|nr:conserved hypothetical protein [gamma proteobacterium NOR5-3]